MVTVNLARAKEILSSLAAMPARGEEITITRHGRTVARSVAPRRAPLPLRSLSRFHRTMPRRRKPSRALLRESRDEQR